MVGYEFAVFLTVAQGSFGLDHLRQIMVTVMLVLIVVMAGRWVAVRGQQVALLLLGCDPAFLWAT